MMLDMPDIQGTMQAVLIADRLDLRGLERGGVPAMLPLTVPLEGGGYAFLFRYGVVVFADADRLRQEAVLKELTARASDPLPVPEHDQVAIKVRPQSDETVDASGAIVLREVRQEHRMIIADILARSLVLAHYETSLAAAFDQIEPLAERLRQGGKGTEGNAMLRHIGDVLRTQHRMVGRVEVSEKPEVLWDNPDLERLFARLEDEYELQERARAIEQKLELISRTAEIVLDLDHQRRSLRVEWYIVILIVFEIVLGFYDRVFG